MRVLTILIPTLLISFFNLWAQKVELICKVNGCDLIPNVYQFNGMDFEVIHQPSKSEAGVYTFLLPPKSAPQFLYVGFNQEQMRPFLLTDEPKLTVTGDCSTFRTAKIEGSELNIAYDNLKSQITNLNQRSGALIQRYRQQMNNPDALGPIVEQMKQVDGDRLKLLETSKQQSPLFGSIVGLNTYLSFHNNQGSYTNEIDYFAGEYFKYVDFSDPALEHCPWVFEAFRGYAYTLSSVGMPQDMHLNVLQKALGKLKEGTGTHMLALAGVIKSLQVRENPNVAYFGEQFVNAYKTKNPQAAAALQKEIEFTKNLLVGGTLPDFTQKTPEGQELSLSSLRGKVVLIDFWASWCGPCRKENPNVVKMYEVYKEKGFEILGVSLDRNKESWVAAIEKDGLTWPHVSDLQGWGNQVAKSFNITAIPHTILVDREGKIIARNLRGPSLEQKLEELFD